MAKKILIYDPISRSGGGLAYIKNLLPVISSSADMEYVIYCNRAIREDIKHVFHTVEIIYSPRGSQMGGLRAFLQRKWVTRSEIQKIAPDVVIYMNQIPVKLNIPSILFLRNALYFVVPGKNYQGPFSLHDKITYRVLRFITSRSVRMADMIVTSSRSFAEVLFQYYGEELNVSTVPFGTNTITKAESRVLRQNKSEIKLLVLSYVFYKGIETVVHCVEIAEKKGINLHLTITDDLKNNRYGRATQLWEYIQKKSLDERVNCTGNLPQEKLRALYGQCDIFIFSSFVESFGQGVLEALNNGIPVLLSDLPVFHELAGDAAVYFKAGDPYDMLKKIEYIVENEDVIKEKVSKGYDIVKKYSWQRHVDELSDVVNKVVA